MQGFKTLTAAAVVLSLVISSEVSAGRRSSKACRPVTCTTTTACATSSVQWYKAKDGTYREKLPYMTALSRAEDADDLEIELRETEEELASVRAAAEDEKAKLLAELEQMRAAVAQANAKADEEGKRAAMAEAAHKQSVEQLADLRDEQERSSRQLEQTREELKQTQQKLVAAEAERKELADEVAALKQAKEAAESTPEEPEAPKQEAVQTDKPAVKDDSEGESGDGDGSASGDDA
jgi:chorismate mutase